MKKFLQIANISREKLRSRIEERKEKEGFLRSQLERLHSDSTSVVSESEISRASSQQQPQSFLSTPDNSRKSRRELRRKQEDSLRSHLEKLNSDSISVTSSPSSVISFPKSSATHYSNLESVSTATSVSSSKRLLRKCKEVDVTFSFGLITSENDAPPVGPYNRPGSSNKMKSISTNFHAAPHKSSLLDSILESATGIASYAVEVSSGNISMVVPEHKKAYVQFVVRDGSYSITAGSRPGTVRSIVQCSIPVEFSTSDGVDFFSPASSSVMAKVIVREALRDAIKNKMLWP